MSDETKHSPEPWKVSSLGYVVSATARCVTDLPPTGLDDARRIVACVNACAGIPTEALEKGELGGALGMAGVVSACSDADGVEDLRGCLRALGGLP